MNKITDVILDADWKLEKHVPVIECPDKVKADEFFAVKATLGKAVAHPNTTEHHIRWIQIFFHPEGVKAPFQIATFEFTAHGEAVEGPNKGGVFTHHEAVTSMKIGTSGTIYALAYCNIHGVWQSSKSIAVQ